MHHCQASACHEHPVRDFAGVAQGSFVAPDHEYPAYLELRLTATDSEGLTATKSVRLDPKTVMLSFRSNPTGLELAVGSAQATTPFSRTVIAGSANSLSAISPQALAGATYDYQSWSDGGAQTHNIVAPATGATYTATYQDGTVDEIKPTVSGISPRHTSIIRDTTPTIKATVKDNFTDLQQADVRLKVAGKLISPTKYAYNAATDALLYNSPRLSRGKKSVQIVATDTAGNAGTRSWSFTIK